MPSQSQIEMLASALIRATVEKDIDWNSTYVPRSLTAASDDQIEAYCETEYKGQTVAVFERRSRAYDGEHDSYYWVGTTVLAVMVNGVAAWESSTELRTIIKLHKLAKEAAFGVDDIFKSLLS